jgi:hypothetical protein
VLSYNFRVEHETPGHVTVGVFAGKRPGSRGKCGELTMEWEEWRELQDILVEGGKARATIVVFSTLGEIGSTTP